jgi:large subunit ribosomal protein L5
MISVKEKAEKSFETMKGAFGYKNKMAAPKLKKVVVSVGTGGAMKRDNKRNDFVLGRLANITGQKPATRQAKKSVASFKIRQGDPIGVAVTLRGARMYAFLDKLFNIALPRTKDFRGIDAKVVDDIGNVTLPVKEHTIFPETADEELKDVFSMGITIVTSAKDKKEATKFFELIGVPFKK